MTKCLYLTYDGLTDPLGQSQILPYLKGLSDKGVQFTVVSFEKKGASTPISLIRKITQQNNIDWIPLTYHKTPPVFSTLYDLIRLKYLCLKLHNKQNFDLVHCRSYLTSLVGQSLKRKGVKFVFDMRGFWADERIEGGIWNVKNPIFRLIYKFFKEKEKSFLTKSDHIVSLTMAGENIIKKKLTNDQNSPVTVIPCCVDTDKFVFDQDAFFFKEKLGVNEKGFVLGYLGSIGTWYMLPEMLLFFKSFLLLHKNSYFVFVTKDDKAQILNEAEKIGIAETHIRIVSAERHEVPAYISIFNWGIFFIKPVFSKQASSPTKQGEMMSVGIPVICNAGIGDSDRIIEEYQSGLILKDFEEKKMRHVALEMLQSKRQTSQLREGAIDYFSLREGIEKYEIIYKSLMNS